MPCRTFPCQAEPCRAVPEPYRAVPEPYRAILYRSIPCHAVPEPYRAILCRTVPYRAIPYRSVPCHAIPYRSAPHRAIPCRTVPFHTVPCRAVPALTPIPPSREVGASPQQGALPGPGTSTPGGCPRNPPEGPGPGRALPQLPAAPTRPLVLQGAEVLKPRSLLPKKQAKQTKSANISQIFPKYFPEHPLFCGTGTSCSGRTELPRQVSPRVGEGTCTEEPLSLCVPLGFAGCLCPGRFGMLHAGSLGLPSW